MDALAQLVRDLVGLGVELRVEKGQPGLHVPDGMREPQRSRAYKAARQSLDVLAEHRHDVARVWMEVATEAPDPVRCVECRSWVFCQPEGRAWAYCEYLFCPGRTDEKASRFQSRTGWRKEVQRQFQVKRLADDPGTADPIPD